MQGVVVHSSDKQFTSASHAGNAFAVALLAGMVDDSMVARRPRESTYPMISVNEAIQMVTAEAHVMDVENVRLTG